MFIKNDLSSFAKIATITVPKGATVVRASYNTFLTYITLKTN